MSTDNRPLREQLVAARAKAKKTGKRFRDLLPILLREQPANVSRHILRSHGLEPAKAAETTK